MSSTIDTTLLDFAQNSQQIFKLGQMYCQSVLNSSNISPNSKKQSQKSKKTHQEIDPNAPKRPLSSYILYFQDVQAKFKEQNAELHMNELTKLIGSSWKNLSEQEKQKYRDMQEKLKGQYGIDLAQYKKEGHYQKSQADTTSNQKKTSENSRNFSNNNNQKPIVQKQSGEKTTQQGNTQNTNNNNTDFENQMEKMYPDLKQEVDNSSKVAKQQNKQQKALPTTSSATCSDTSVLKKSPNKKKLQKMKVKQKLLDELDDNLEVKPEKEKNVIKFENNTESSSNNNKDNKKRNHAQVDEDDGFIDDDGADQNHIDYGYYNTKENQDEAENDNDRDNYYYREYFQDKKKKQQNSHHNNIKDKGSNQQQQPSFNPNKLLQQEQLQFEGNDDLDVNMKIKKKTKKV